VDADKLDRQRCPYCHSKAEVVFLPKRRSYAPPTVYFENAQGKRLYAHKIPKQFEKLGYQRVEVSGFERGRFEKQTRAQLNAEGARRRESEREQYERDRSQRHAELRQMSNGFDVFHRDLARHAMEQEDREPISSYDSEFRIGD